MAGIRADAGLGGGSNDLTDPGNQSNPLAGGFSASGSTKPVNHVYMGTKPGKVYGGLNVTAGSPGVNAPVYKTAPVSNVVTEDDAKNSWYSMSDKDRETWGAYAVSIGLISEDDSHDYTRVAKAWEDSVTEAAKWYTNGKKKITPYQAATLLASHSLTLAQAKASKGKASANQSGTQTQRQVTVNLTDPTTARAVVASAMQQYLGQDPSDEQVSAFTKTLQDYEQDNPSVTTTKNVSDANGNVTSHSTTSGGADPNDFINNQVQSLPDYGAYQAGTTMMSWLQQALGTPAGN